MESIGNEAGGEGVLQRFRRGGWGDRVLTTMGLLDVVLYTVVGVSFLVRFIVHLLTCYF